MSEVFNLPLCFCIILVADNDSVNFPSSAIIKASDLPTAPILFAGLIALALEGNITCSLSALIEKSVWDLNISSIAVCFTTDSPAMKNLLVLVLPTKGFNLTLASAPKTNKLSSGVLAVSRINCSVSTPTTFVFVNAFVIPVRSAVCPAISPINATGLEVNSVTRSLTVSLGFVTNPFTNWIGANIICSGSVINSPAPLNADKPNSAPSNAVPARTVPAFFFYKCEYWRYEW